ncbi:MAG: DNA polymerase III subunit alpha [Bryobacterales bacterium]|nr:DNA polymerase III subunit alpha [Bryobacteraceae bacterium]MDW8353011.1 DNA polymerase III subunit alpha [Bryobacterales bacterium]
MQPKPFVHLHCHTDYSLLDGACEISQLMDQVEALGMPAVAMTDHGNLFGAVHFYDAAKRRGIHPVIGCEVYVAQQSHKVRTESNRYNHLVLLCETQEGYRNLIKLVSTGFLEGFYYKPRIDKDLLAQHAEGLIALSACLQGDIPEALLAERYDEARRLAYTYVDIFGRDNFFLEMQDHGLEADRKVLPQIYRLSRETGIPLVATNDSHYLRKEDARAHEILLCIQTGKTLSDSGRMSFGTPEFYLKSRAEMLALFHGVEEALDRTWEIAQRCQVQLEKVREPFPKFEVPEGHSTDTYFEYVTRQGFERRRPRLEALWAAGRLKHALPEYEERLAQEIRTIQQMKFSGYFLIVWDFIRFAKSKGIPVGPGRGSAAGSLVSYAMGITDIDPLQYGLLFERFLNPERVSLPDIDIDFCMHRRGEVIQYVTEKYGRDRVAQIITFNTLGARAAIKDVGRALDMSYAEVDRLTKMVPNVVNITLEQAMKMEPALAEAGRKDPRVADLLAVAQRLEGMCRNASVHAAGVVISPVPLEELVPLYRTNRDEVVTQYDMSALEKLSLLKMDFLGLTTLTLVEDALGLIERHHGVKLSLEEIPLDDPATYELFSRGLTSGVFQFESAGMRDILRRYQPSRIEDLIALNALYRPGPIQGGMIDDFIARKHGRKQVTYELPELKEILEETYGVIVYQEQVMQISHKLAGYSLGEADILRRAMGKKKPEEMAAQRQRFIEGAVARGFPRKKVERIFELMEQFAGYGFNKSHSAAYAFLAYVTAYLKAHYPVDFMAALLTSETGNTAKVAKYINECREMGIAVLPPDVNASDWNFTPDPAAPGGKGIRFGLGAIKNVGPSAVDAILAARAKLGRFRSLYQFCEHVDLGTVNRRVIESLIKAGAMDSLGGTRAQLFAAVEGAIERGQKLWRDRQSGQAGLFGGLLETAPGEDPPLPAASDWPAGQKLAGEKETLGFFVTGHPLDAYEEKIKELATHDTSALEGLERGAEVTLCGVLSSVQRRRNREGKPWASVQIEDRLGTVEGVVFTTSYERVREFLLEDLAVMVRGSVLPEENAPPKISVQDIVPLDVARVAMPSLISIRVWLGSNGGAKDKAAALRRLFELKPGQTAVRLRLEKPRDFAVILDVEARVRPDREFQAEVERICGPEAIEVLAE